jgi:hypothetical protein
VEELCQTLSTDTLQELVSLWLPDPLTQNHIDIALNRFQHEVNYHSYSQ